MAILNKKQFKNHWYELLAPSSLTILWIIYSVKDFLRHTPVLQICSSLMWVLMSISLVFSSWHGLFRVKNSEEADILECDRVFSKKWFAKDLPRMMVHFLMTIFILSLIILAINNSIYVSDSSNYSPFYYIGSMITALGVIAINTIDILKPEPKTAKIGNLFIAGLILCGAVLMSVSVSIQ